MGATKGRSPPRTIAGLDNTAKKLGTRALREAPSRPKCPPRLRLRHRPHRPRRGQMLARSIRTPRVGPMDPVPVTRRPGAKRRQRDRGGWRRRRKTLPLRPTWRRHWPRASSIRKLRLLGPGRGKCRPRCRRCRWAQSRPSFATTSALRAAWWRSGAPLPPRARPPTRASCPRWPAAACWAFRARRGRGRGGPCSASSPTPQPATRSATARWTFPTRSSARRTRGRWWPASRGRRRPPCRRRPWSRLPPTWSAAGASPTREAPPTCWCPSSPWGWTWTPPTPPRTASWPLRLRACGRRGSTAAPPRGSPTCSASSSPSTTPCWRTRSRTR